MKTTLVATASDLPPDIRVKFEQAPDHYFLSRMERYNPGLLDALKTCVDNGVTTDKAILAIACDDGSTPLQMECIQRALNALRVDRVLMLANTETSNARERNQN